MCAELRYIIGAAALPDDRVVLPSCGNLRHRTILFSGCTRLSMVDESLCGICRARQMSLQCVRNKKRAICVFFAFVICYSGLRAVCFCSAALCILSDSSALMCELLGVV